MEESLKNEGNQLYNYSSEQPIQASFDQFIKLYSVFLHNCDIAKEQIEEHHNNLDFYFEHFVNKKALNANCHNSIENGANPELVSEFIGDFLVHKAMWTGIEDQKSMIASIIAFYTWLTEQGRFTSEALQILIQTIHEKEDSWFLTMDKYADEALELWQSESEIEFDDEFEEAFRAEVEEDLIDVPDDITLDDLIIPPIIPGGSAFDEHELEELESLADEEENTL